VKREQRRRRKRKEEPRKGEKERYNDKKSIGKARRREEKMIY
jgi:hypothetical protein